MPSVQLSLLAFRPILALLAISLSLSCTGPQEQAPPPNVLLISLDALRADHLGCYGYERSTSPFIDELAQRSLRFANAFANTHGTAPSHTTMLSGLYQESHRVGYTSGAVPERSIPEQVTLLSQTLQGLGYRTIGVTGGGNVGARFGFDRGFDHYDDRGNGVDRVVRRSLRQVEQAAASGQPIFLFFHTYEIHSPYRPPLEYAERFDRSGSDFVTNSENLLRFIHSARTKLTAADLERVTALYDAGIAYTDDQLRLLWDGLERLGLLDDALIIFTSDHGEELGEHGGLLHRNLLYDELLRIPLLIQGNGIEPAVREDFAGLVDVVPTVLDFVRRRGVQVSLLERNEGRSLLADQGSPSTAGNADTVFAQYGNLRYAVRTKQWKLITTPSEDKTELYDIGADPQEQHDIAEQHADVVNRLKAELRRWLQSTRPVMPGSEVELSEEEMERLRALGYVASSSAR